MKLHNIGLPIVAIGGILEEDIEAIMQTGVSGIAVSGGILNAENPVEEMRKQNQNKPINQIDGNKNQV